MPAARTALGSISITVAPAAALVATLCAAPAHAQLGGTVSLQSDGRFRGISLNDERPQLQLSLAWDGNGALRGWYGGAMLTEARFGAMGRSVLLQGYAGHVVPLTPDLDGEFGATVTRFPQRAYYDYAEAYVGLLAERWNARLHRSGNYYGLHQRTLYAELNGHWPLSDTVQGFAHVGALRGDGVRRNPAGAARTDLRIGAALRRDRVEWQLAWVAVGRGGPHAGPYAVAADTRRRAWVLGIATSF